MEYGKKLVMLFALFALCASHAFDLSAGYFSGLMKKIEENKLVLIVCTGAAAVSLASAYYVRKAVREKNEAIKKLENKHIWAQEMVTDSATRSEQHLQRTHEAELQLERASEQQPSSTQQNLELGRQIEIAQRRIGELEKEIGECNEQLQERATRIREYEQGYSELSNNTSDQIARLTQQLEKANSDLAEARTQCNGAECKAYFELANSNMARVRAKCSELQSQVRALKAGHVALKGDFQAKLQEINHAVGEQARSYRGILAAAKPVAEQGNKVLEDQLRRTKSELLVADAFYVALGEQLKTKSAELEQQKVMHEKVRCDFVARNKGLRAEADNWKKELVASEKRCETWQWAVGNEQKERKNMVAIEVEAEKTVLVRQARGFYANQQALTQKLLDIVSAHTKKEHVMVESTGRVRFDG